MLNRIAKFSEHEDGAITVDWVILTAGLVGLGTIVVLSISDGVQHVDSQTGDALSKIEVQEIVFDFDN
ncbi:hypothetical protein [Ruegeria sp. Alg231-54]|uniref:hypothetical protein n=1 Tax=Ruegeria sp. Alg231-54 TaxID=1922221 RepID=UPI000D54EEE0|nr:hypothetical protein [Ruegeria sp. Alg231-54]